MELYDEENVNKKESKLPIVIGICIGVLIFITIAIIFGIIYLKNTITTIKVDGQVINGIEEILYIQETENKSEIYIPIRKIAKFLNYKDYSGDYKNKSEDNTKCYVTNEEETAMFILDSNILIKTRGNSDYEYIELDENVFEKNGDLYTNVEGIEKAFNVMFEASEDKMNIDIYTMDYLNQYFAAKLQIEDYSEEFSDKKAIFEDMIVIGKEKQYGVINAGTGKPILETKYEYIKYLPATSDFLVKNNEKYGILSKEGAIKLRIVYDEIKIMDNQNGLYLVKQNNLYGVVNTEGKTVIQPEYKEIGIDLQKYTQNGLENQYVLLDNIIPIKNVDGLWGVFNIKGEKIRDFEFSSVGCSTIEVNNAFPAVVIPSYKIIVVQKNKKYNLMTIEGEDIISNYVLDSVCIKTNTETGENKFYMTYNDNSKIKSVEEYLTSIGR